MYIIIFFILIFLIGFLVNKQSKLEDIKNEKYGRDIYNIEDKIETGYPTKRNRSLHINCIKEPPLPNHNYTNHQLNQFDDDYDQNDINKKMYTKNMFIESHYELNLSLFERDLTVEMVKDAYEKILNEHLNKLTNGIPNVFNIKEKQDARDYLLSKLKKENKS